MLNLSNKEKLLPIDFTAQLPESVSKSIVWFVESSAFTVVTFELCESLS